MNTETINQIKDLMQPIAEKIGQGAEFGWEVVMKQQYVIAIQGLFWAIISTIILIASILFVKYAIKKDKEDHYGSSWDITGNMVGVFGIGGSLIGIIAGSITAINHFINPSYYAIQFFIGLVK